MKTFIICLILSVIVAAVIAQKQCSTGETIMRDCNMCMCKNGFWGCTRKFCIKREKRNTICMPGTTFKIDCNTCSCSVQGTEMKCTRRLCEKRT